MCGLLSFFRRRVGSAEVALDLTAETFAAALEASPRYEPRPEPARGSGSATAIRKP
jgi:DNA-directed RNA polymerase specialized sigma24 family protein